MDSRLFIIQDHDPEALCKSFDELNLFQDSQGDLVTVRTMFDAFISVHTRLTQPLYYHNINLSLYNSMKLTTTKNMHQLQQNLSLYLRFLIKC